MKSISFIFTFGIKKFENIKGSNINIANTDSMCLPVMRISLQRANISKHLGRVAIFYFLDCSCVLDNNWYTITKVIFKFPYMGYALVYPNLLPYICAQVYPRTDVILEDIVSEYNSLEGILVCLYCIKLRNVLNLRSYPPDRLHILLAFIHRKGLCCSL